MRPSDTFPHLILPHAGMHPSDPYPNLPSPVQICTRLIPIPTCPHLCRYAPVRSLSQPALTCAGVRPSHTFLHLILPRASMHPSDPYPNLPSPVQICTRLTPTPPSPLRYAPRPPHPLCPISALTWASL
ncbi:uncharacterized protein LOC127044498 [Gopherus flavomarginatus]|uniref:uncharacterized protein LOC127044498 n=1 Tax=Gopherus flavomarginatus TaxID=286002 RepID=UPI0021CC4DC9|nr:uncharacterized protein LOC127044498 [Gopherus flavomarginatus]